MDAHVLEHGLLGLPIWERSRTRSRSGFREGQAPSRSDTRPTHAAASALVVGAGLGRCSDRKEIPGRASGAGSERSTG
jgi:hypothetical protein